MRERDASVKQLYSQYWKERFGYFKEAYINYWKNIIDFNGSINRWDYIYTVIGSWIASIIITIVTCLIGYILQNQIVSRLYFVANIIANLSFTIRRFHDLGYTWKHIFWYLVPIYGWVRLTIELFSPGIDEVATMYNSNNINNTTNSTYNNQVNSNNNDDDEVINL